MIFCIMVLFWVCFGYLLVFIGVGFVEEVIWLILFIGGFLKVFLLGVDVLLLVEIFIMNVFVLEYVFIIF